MIGPLAFLTAHEQPEVSLAIPYSLLLLSNANTTIHISKLVLSLVPSSSEICFYLI
jgi:hypothetical protein